VSMAERRVCVSKWEYRGIVRKMVADGRRTRRQRELERAHGQDLPSLLKALHRKHDGNASAVLRDLNDRIEGSSVSRPTLYQWLEAFGVGE
jgi:hypothetical protein